MAYSYGSLSDTTMVSCSGDRNENRRSLCLSGIGHRWLRTLRSCACSFVTADFCTADDHDADDNPARSIAGRDSRGGGSGWVQCGRRAWCVLLGVVSVGRYSPQSQSRSAQQTPEPASWIPTWKHSHTHTQFSAVPL